MKTESKKKTPAKSKPELLPTGNPEMLVKVSRRGSGDNMYIVGYGVDARTGRKIEKTTVKRKLHTPESLKSVTSTVVYQVQQKFSDLKASQKPKAITASEGIYTNALKQAISEDKSSLQKGGKRGWNDETFHKTIVYCLNNVFPRLDRYGFEICEEDIHTIQEELIQKAYDSKCSNSKRDDAERSVAAQLYRADYVYQRLREQFPDLPRLDLKLDKRGPRVQAEQCKALPDKVRVMLARLLLRLLATPYGGQALAAAFMLFCGLRTSEAAGVVYGDIRRSGAFGSLFVCRREQNGEFVNTLKTKNAYRNVVLPKILMDFLDIRIDRLKNLGFSDDQISKLPIACASGNPETLTRANAVSALVRELLQLCGISDEFLQAMRDLADCEPDIVDDDERVTDVAAYTLRRDWCTRACHVCGFTMDQVDYLLGHAPKSNRRQDYLTPEKQAELALKLERYVFDPDHSAHPAASVQVIEPGTEKEFPTFQAFRFSVDSRHATRINITFSCMEPGEALKLVLPAGVIPNYKLDYFGDTPEMRQSRTLMGSHIPEKLIREWIREADKIDLSRWEGS